MLVSFHGLRCGGQLSLLAIGLVVVCAGLFGQEAARPRRPSAAATKTHSVKDFTLKDSAGRIHTHAEWKHHEAVVVASSNATKPTQAMVHPAEQGPVVAAP